jgi:excisionase family DNA binding protein
MARSSLKFLPPPTDKLDATATRLLAQILDRLDSDKRRPIPYYRVRELCPPLSKATVLRLVRSGDFRAIKCGSLLLIEAKSVDEWIASGKPWGQP